MLPDSDATSIPILNYSCTVYYLSLWVLSLIFYERNNAESHSFSIKELSSIFGSCYHYYAVNLPTFSESQAWDFYPGSAKIFKYPTKSAHIWRFPRMYGSPFKHFPVSGCVLANSAIATFPFKTWGIGEVYCYLEQWFNLCTSLK